MSKSKNKYYDKNEKFTDKYYNKLRYTDELLEEAKARVIARRKQYANIK